MEPLELRTHTRLWQVEKKLYKLYDYTLPMPVSLRMLGIFLLSSVVWITFCVAVGIPFAPPFGHLVWITPPAALTWLGNKPVSLKGNASATWWPATHRSTSPNPDRWPGCGHTPHPTPSTHKPPCGAPTTTAPPERHPSTPQYRQPNGATPPHQGRPVRHIPPRRVVGVVSGSPIPPPRR